MYYFGNLISIENAASYNSYLSPIEKFYSLTCPSYIFIDGEKQLISLKSNVQIAEYDTILDCKIEYKTDGSMTIDSDVSYIYVFNDLTEGSTSEFQINDILLIDEDIAHLIPEECRNPLVYKIINIKDVDIDNDNDNDNDMDISIKNIIQKRLKQDSSQFEILKLKIKSVKSPFEYILRVKAEKSNVDVSDIVDIDDVKRNLLINLLDLEFSEDLEFKKSFDFEYDNAGGNGAGRKVELTGGVELEVLYGYSFTFELNANCKFEWDLLEDIGDIMLEFYLSGQYELRGYFNVTITGSATLSIEKLLFKEILNPPQINIAGVPVIYHPYFQLDASATVIPIEIFAAIECRYGRTFKVGYHFENDRTLIPHYDRYDSRNGYIPSGSKIDYGNKDTLDDCAAAIYGTAYYFSYNSNDGRCFAHLSESGSQNHYYEGTYWKSYVIDLSCSGSNYERCDQVGDGEWCWAHWHCGDHDDRGRCCNGCCTEAVKDWLGIYYCPHECVGKLFGSQGTCGGTTYTCSNTGKLGWCDVGHRVVDTYGNCWQCLNCWWDISNAKHVDVDNSYAITSDEELDTNGCYPDFSITNPDNTSDNECGFRVGLDIEFDLYIGVKVYFIINAYIKAQLDIPMGLNIPEISTEVCPSHDCNTHDHYDTTVLGVNLYKHDLYVSADFGIYLSFYIGVGVDASILATILEVVAGASVDDNDVATLETQVGPTITIFETDVCIGKVEIPIFTEYLWQDCCTSPIEPGCWMLNGDCPNQDFDPNGQWFRDVWGEENNDAALNDQNCAERRQDYNSWCGSSTFQYKFNPTAYLVVDGAFDFNDENKDPECHVQTDTTGIAGNNIGVRCCDSDVDDATASTPSECLEGATWYEARDLCTSTGLQLCTRVQLEYIRTDGLPNAAGTGCNFDEYHIWTADTCSTADNVTPNYNEYKEPKSYNHHSDPYYVPQASIDYRNYHINIIVFLLLIISCTIIIVYKMCYVNKNYNYTIVKQSELSDTENERFV